MIRRAQYDDLPAMVEMARKHHAMSGFDVPFYDGAVHDFLSVALDGYPGAAFLSRKGMIVGTLLPVWCAADYRLAVEVIWWAEDGQGGKLLDAFEAWAKEEGAAGTRITTLAANPRAARLLERRGYSAAETSYARAI